MTLRLVPMLLVALPALAAERRYAIDSDKSRAEAHVGKAGLGSFAGHEHVIAAPLLRGEVVADFADLSRSSVSVDISARALKVREEGEPQGDPPKVEQAMKSRKVLDAARFAIIRLRSTQVSGKAAGPGAYALSVTCDLSLHGVTRSFTVPVQVAVQGDSLTATGTMVVKQTDFGIEPTVAAGGLVKVADEVKLTFDLVARAAP